MTKRTHNYPAERKPTGPRPNAGPKPKLEEPVRFTAVVEERHLAWLDSQEDDRQTVLRGLIETAIRGI